MIKIILLFLAVYGTSAARAASHPRSYAENDADAAPFQHQDLPGTENLAEKAIPLEKLIGQPSFPGVLNLAERTQVPQDLPGTSNLAEKRIPDFVLQKLFQSTTSGSNKL